MKASTPGFCRPIELSIPEGVSEVRGGELPSLGSRVSDLVMRAPRRRRSKKGAYSCPIPKVPEAGITGFFRRMPARSTSRFTDLTPGEDKFTLTPALPRREREPVLTFSRRGRESDCTKA